MENPAKKTENDMKNKADTLDIQEVTTSAIFWKSLKERGINTDNVIEIPFTRNLEHLTPSQKTLGGAELLDSLNDLLRKYLVLPENASETAALWTAATHAFSIAWFSPILLISSSGPGEGKSTFQEIMELVTAGGYKVDVATEPGIRHKVSENQGKPFTLLIDEADSFFKDKPNLKASINASWKRGGKALMAKPNSDGQWTSDEQSLWTPLVIAGIGEQWVWSALRSRSFLIKMKRKLPSERVEDWNTDTAHRKAKEVGKALGQWVRDNRTALAGAKPDIPRELQNRGADNWRLMLAIADLAGGHWPDTARRVAVAMSGGKPEPADNVKVLAAIQDVFVERGTDKIASQELAVELANRRLLIAPEPDALAACLRDFSIQPKNIKFSPKEVRKGYRREQFEDAWLRYEVTAPKGSGKISVAAR